jgi:Icc-related predicted phosphoesterase
MGNDDSVDLEYSDELIQPIHGRRVPIDVYNFVGYQYTPPFVGDAFVKTDAEIEADLPLWSLWLTPGPSVATRRRWAALTSVTKEHVESCNWTVSISKPALAHIHGHIHEQFGRDGNHFVAAAGVCQCGVN